MARSPSSSTLSSARVPVVCSDGTGQQRRTGRKFCYVINIKRKVEAGARTINVRALAVLLKDNRLAVNPSASRNPSKRLTLLATAQRYNKSQNDTNFRFDRLKDCIKEFGTRYRKVFFIIFDAAYNIYWWVLPFSGYQVPIRIEKEKVRPACTIFCVSYLQLAQAILRTGDCSVKRAFNLRSQYQFMKST